MRAEATGKQIALLRHRKTRAALAMLLYVMAVLGLPALHISFHQDDHDHEGGGIHHHAAGLSHDVPDDDDDDDHDDGHPDHHDHDHEHHHGSPGDHGMGSLTHFTSAYLPDPGTAVVGQCHLLEALALPLSPPAQVSGQYVETPLGPRGPPSAA